MSLGGVCTCDGVNLHLQGHDLDHELQKCSPSPVTVIPGALLWQEHLTQACPPGKFAARVGTVAHRASPDLVHLASLKLWTPGRHLATSPSPAAPGKPGSLCP